MALAQGSLSSSLFANMMKAPVGFSTLYISLRESSFANQWKACMQQCTVIVLQSWAAQAGALLADIAS